MMKKKIRKSVKRKNPQVSVDYLEKLVGKKVILLVNNGYVTEILEYRNDRFRLTHVVGKEAIFAFTFLKEDVKRLDFEEGGQYWIDIRS